MINQILKFLADFSDIFALALLIVFFVAMRRKSGWLMVFSAFLTLLVIIGDLKAGVPFFLVGGYVVILVVIAILQRRYAKEKEERRR